jgi:type I restriction enzyme S subunit
MRKGWTKTTLDKISDICRDRLDPSRLPPNERLVHWSIPALDETGGPVIDTAGDIGSHKFLVNRDSIVYSLLNPRIPRFALIHGGHNVCCSTEFAVLQPRENVRLNFLWLLASSDVFQDAIGGLANGTTKSRERVRPGDLAKIELLLPPIREQERIVDLVTSVDAYIESLQQQVDAARTARNAVLHDLLSAGGDDWTETPLGDVLEIVRGGSPRPIDAFLTNDATGVNWIKIGDASASSKYIYTTGQKIRQEGVSRSRLVKEGDFILSNSMSFGRPYIMRTTGCIHDGWLLLSNIHVTFDEDYLYNVLLSQDVQSQFESLAAGSGVRNLNIDVVKQVRVPVPPRVHQVRIASTANGFDEYVRAAEDALEEARGLRSGLLADLLSGAHEIPESYDRFLGAA